MADESFVVYSQDEADVVIRAPKSVLRFGRLQTVGKVARPARVQAKCDLRVQSTIYDPAEFGKDVFLVVSIRRQKGFSFMLVLDRTVVHRVDYQWKKGVEHRCPCRAFSMPYEPHQHTYEEDCYRRTVRLRLEELESMHSEFEDALQDFLQETHIQWHDAFGTRFKEFLVKEFWRTAAQTSLMGFSEALEAVEDASE